MLSVEIVPVQETLVLRARGSELLILPHHVRKLKEMSKPKDFSAYFHGEALVNRPARKLFEAWLRKDTTLWQRIYHTVHKEMELGAGDGETKDAAPAKKAAVDRTTVVSKPKVEKETVVSKPKAEKEIAKAKPEKDEKPTKIEKAAKADRDEKPTKKSTVAAADTKKTTEKKADKPAKAEKPAAKKTTAAEGKKTTEKKADKDPKKPAKPAAKKK